MHFFPIVPYNVPRDDLAKYLEMYDSAAEALLASRDAEIHAEWDINVRAPVMRELRGLHGREELGYTDAMTSRPTGDRAVHRGVPRGDLARMLGYTDAMTARPTGDRAVHRGVPRGDLARTLVSHMRLEAYDVDVFDPWTIGAVGQTLGQDALRLTNLQAGVDIVDGRWAQRAANAFLATVGATPIQVDGVPGTQTITALRFAMRRFYAAASHTDVQPDTGQADINGIPMPTRSGTSVALPIELSNYLATLTQVADPAPVPHQAAAPPVVDLPLTPTPPAHQAPASIPGAASGGGLLVLFALGAGAWYLSKRR